MKPSEERRRHVKIVVGKGLSILCMLVLILGSLSLLPFPAAAYAAIVSKKNKKTVNNRCLNSVLISTILKEKTN